MKMIPEAEESTKAKTKPKINRRDPNSVLSGFSKVDPIFIFGIVICVCLALMHAVSTCHYANFFPINGTFQNFNPVRRLLNGQIPYKDFVDYLGLGHVLVGGFMTAILGVHYQASLIAFSFLSFISLGLLSFAISLAILHTKRTAIAITDLIMVFLLVQSLQKFQFLNSLPGISAILGALNSSLGSGNSARFVRGLILPLTCLVVLGIQKVKSFFSPPPPQLVKSGIIGIIAGFCLIWSNDYGISCWICLQLVNAWLVFCQKRKLGIPCINLILSFVISLLTVFILVEIISLGNIRNWFSSTLGTGVFQRWYYNSRKSYYLWDIDIALLTLLMAGLCLFFMYKMFVSVKSQSQESLYKNAILSFICMTCFCAVQEYRLLSGGDSREVAYSALFLIIIDELYDFFRKRLKDRAVLEKSILVLSAVTCLCWFVYTCKKEVQFNNQKYKEGTYIEQMGGNVTSLDSDLLRADSFLNGKEFFATYSSGQEVVSDVYQPSGTDYIIHVLGDQQRAAYLNIFTKGDFDYTATIKESFTDWEYWVQRANWFFYRELYQGWHPVFTNSYEVFWERNKAGESHHIESGYVIESYIIDETTCKISVSCEQPINGMADVYIDYSILKRKGLSSVFCFQQMLQVKNTGTIYANQGQYYESNYLRPTSAEYIPVRIVNGYGELTLTSQPEKDTYLTVNSVACSKILTVDSDYVEITHLDTLDGRSKFYIPKTAKNINALHNAATVEYGDFVSNVDEIYEENNSIVICCNIVYSQADHNNMLRIIGR